jgi:predicted RNA methylase
MSLVSENTSRGVTKPGNTRVTGKEQYYTPRQTAQEVLERVLKQVEKVDQKSFLEPAGGTGSFVEAAQSAGFKRLVSMDIEPLHPKVEKGDFLSSNLDLTGAVCVSNPPFGRNNSLSIPFFNKAARYSDVIAFIVPRSWRKWSVLNRLHQSFHLVDDWDLTIDYVDAKGEHTHGTGNLRTCVQVWKRDDTKIRPKILIPDHGLISRVSPKEADVSFTLFGYSCGTVKEDFPRIPNSTQTFFKLHHPRALEALKAVDYSRFYKHTAYTEALGTQEINFLLNEYLGLETMKYSDDPSDDFYLGFNQPQHGGSGDDSRIF